MSEVATSDARAGEAATAPLAPGVTPPSRLDRQGVFLTDVIVELGFADADAVQEAVDAARQSARTTERCLLDNGTIDEHQLSLALAERNGLDHVDLDLFEVDREAVGLIDKSTAARYTALPVAFASDGTLIVAFEDPYDMLGISDIEVMAKSEVRPVVAAGSQIQRLIEDLPDRPSVPPSQSLEHSSAPGPSAEPEHVPEAAPEPVPEAEIAAEPEPTLGPEPEGEVAAEPEPVPEPAPVAEPVPETVPEPEVAEESDSVPEPVAEFESVSESEPLPAPEPEPVPEPQSIPTPEPVPEPEPPAPLPGPQPVPMPAPELEPVPEPINVPEPQPEPELPDRAAAAHLQAETEPEHAPLEGDAGELSTTLVALQDRARHAVVLAEAAERRIDEFEDVDARAQQATTTLSEERARFEDERRQGAEREEDLRREVSAALDRIGELEQSLAEVGAAAELARTATEKLAALSSIVEARQRQ